MFSPSLSADSTECLRNKLAWLRSRYDTGAVAPAVLAIIRQFETEIAWRENASVTDSRASASEPQPPCRRKET